MVKNMDLEEGKKHYCIRGKHVVIICITVVVCSLAVGLGVGLSRPEATSTATESPPAPTADPTQTPEPSRGPCKPSTDSSGDWKNFRLPDYVKPIHYDLLLEPDLMDDTYKGTVEIQLEVSKPTRHLWLHIRETFVTEKPRLKLLGRQGVQKHVSIESCFEYEPQEYVVVEAAEELRKTGPGEVYVLSLDFQGWLNGSLVGFYRVIYTEAGVTKKIAATDHEPTDARKSFPCFDEPNKKATYKITIIHDDNYEALSNMPLESAPELLSGNKKRTAFQKSVPMSTYLVCFAVHQFKHVERKSARGIPLRIYTQPSQLPTAEYAADTTKVIFDYFEEYFNMNYSISKLDKIAIPDFGTGAMENWGLITYRETNLLYDSNQSSSYNKQRVASVIAHELVHQWFGNIVTMDWWDDLWLNEGFASFFEYIGVEKAEPTWGMRDIMIISDVLPVMVDDALLSSHPIIVNVSTPAEITSVFDSISYSKGASILRMLEDWMGKDLFRDGCRKYLKDYYFKNAKTSNFWDSLADASGFPVGEVMETWTKQMGYPVVDLTFTNTEAKLKQSRFLLDPNADANQPPSPLGYKWTIPIKWHSVKSNKNMSDLFNMSSAEHILKNYSPSEDGLLKINNDHIGFYRVNHDDQMWNTISEQLQDTHLEFDAADRASYIDDVFALARADKIDYGNAFNLTMYLNNETYYIVWDRVASSIAYVRDMLSGNDALYPKFQKLFRSHVKKISSELGWDDVGTQTNRLLREIVHSIACQMGNQDALNNASDLFNQWIDGTLRDIPVNLRLLVYRYGMKNAGNEAKWTIMFERYKNTGLAQEKDKLLYGLASVQDIKLLWRLLEASKDESVVRSQDLFTLVRYVSYNPMGQSMAWDWTTLNWEYLVKRYTINDRSLGRLLKSLSVNYNTEQQLWKMEHFFSLTPDAGAGVIPRQQALETVKNNIKWIQANENEIQMWLERNVL
ncbi:glutamyl aminopeptidase [Corythoichthys intestinalis]|uniref:glutamyl aminopeptidase n=1 Tax=Corythoichthys intestinalis TaxID=161448 RepID=UPI0025A681C4|nr:glutamyl aminopeptidase [Corythoichthys intestinalis]XP_061798717.1 glutamyl aminopeptidase-like [Nerophis lumbriciformis]